MTKVICPFCLTTMIKNFNNLTNLNNIKFFQCPNPDCSRIIGNPFYHDHTPFSYELGEKKLQEQDAATYV